MNGRIASAEQVLIASQIMLLQKPLTGPIFLTTVGTQREVEADGVRVNQE
jgi:hypothetical protein